MQPIRYPGSSPLQTEEDAWGFLDWLRLQDQESTLEDLSLSSPEWAKLSLTYKGKAYNSTITPSIMEALLTLQGSIHRLYALAKYGEERAVRLTNSDRGNTELVVQVLPGSSELGIDGTQIASHFLDVVGHSMNDVEVMAVVISALLMFFGAGFIKLAIEQRGKLKIKELELKAKETEATDRAAERAEAVRQTIALSQEETKRAEIIATASQRFPKIVLVQAEAAKVAEATLKSIARSETLEVQGLSISGPVAADIITTPRSSADMVTVRSIFQIMAVDSSAVDGFRARLKDVESGDVFSATLKDVFLSEREGETVQQAFWAKRLVRLELDARLLRGQIKDAEIVKATMLDRASPQDIAPIKNPETDI